MSKKELKMKILEVNEQLTTLIQAKNYNLLDQAIIQCSRRLDYLIVAYMQAHSEGAL